MRFDFRGAVALVLALTLAVCICALVLHWAVSDRPLGQQAATSLSVTLGGLIGAVCSYLGRYPAPPTDGRKPTMTDTTAVPPDPDNLPTDDTTTSDETTVHEKWEEHRQEVHGDGTDDSTTDHPDGALTDDDQGDTDTDQDDDADPASGQSSVSH